MDTSSAETRIDPRFRDGHYPISDEVALAVGKAIIAYGHLDQTIYELTHHLGLQRRHREDDLGMERSEQGHPWEESRFAFRLKKLRSLVAELSNDQSIISAFDALRTRLVPIEKMRAHLAHGRLKERDCGVEIFDARGWAEMTKSWDKAAAEHRAKGLTNRQIFEIIGTEQLKIGDRIINVWYSLEEIKLLEDNLHLITREMDIVVNRAWEVVNKVRMKEMFGQ